MRDGPADTDVDGKAMTPGEIRERADAFAARGHKNNADLLRALADVVKAAKSTRHTGHDTYSCRGCNEVAVALARVEALKP